MRLVSFPFLSETIGAHGQEDQSGSSDRSGNGSESLAEADKMIRYCPECGLIGPVRPSALTCCPDSFGMSIRRWQAEKLERMLDRLRAALTKATGSQQ